MKHSRIWEIIFTSFTIAGGIGFILKLFFEKYIKSFEGVMMNVMLVVAFIILLSLFMKNISRKKQNG